MHNVEQTPDLKCQDILGALMTLETHLLLLCFLRTLRFMDQEIGKIH